uniref:non-specific serine/threonine protein kinase n=1 Tax=Macaca mulatta TaxID=9544 RepID=F7HTG4_MACMU
MEFCAGGDLSRFIHTRRILPEKVARVFMQQLASALQFLHERSISHLDLKPQNILLSSLEKPHLKLADFGFAQHMSPWDEKHVLRGSPLYMAPEMVCQRQYDARVDLWSVGVILYGRSWSWKRRSVATGSSSSPCDPCSPETAGTYCSGSWSGTPAVASPSRTSLRTPGWTWSTCPVGRVWIEQPPWWCRL